VIPRLLAPALLCLALAAPASAAEDEFKLVIENHKFEPAELVVPAGRKVKLVVENRDATPEEFDSHSLNREKVIAGKSTVTIFIGPLKPGSYPFVGEYNEKTAKGTIVAK
jgi:plastocyanin